VHCWGLVLADFGRDPTVSEAADLFVHKITHDFTDFSSDKCYNV